LKSMHICTVDTEFSGPLIDTKVLISHSCIPESVALIRKCERVKKGMAWSKLSPINKSAKAW